jgi:CheY-like chemotaxis protein
MPRYERVLLVDDNEADNFFHSIMIERAGYAGEVVACDSGQAALDYLAQSSRVSTLILLDVNMPSMSGFEFARLAEPLLRARLPHATIVMLTSSSADGDLEKARASEQIDGYIIKPLMVEMARRVLDGDFDAL